MYLYDSITYVDNPLVQENTFRSTPPDDAELPTFAASRGKLPRPFWEGHQRAIDCYWKAWELAFAHLRKPTPENGFVASYIDTAFNDHLFMWDSAFILQFGKYGMRAFDFLRTLDNFYAKQHPDGFICREIDEADGQDCFQRHDPASTGPNLLPWTEWDYYRFFGDLERLRRVYPPLAAYYHWLKRYQTWPDGSYWYSGWGSGLDNQPRQEPVGIDVANREAVRRFRWLHHGHMAWIDACLHQILSARILIDMARVIGRERDVPQFQEEIDSLTRLVNERMWDEETAFYYDLRRDGSISGVMSVVAYWALLADVVPSERLERFVAHLRDPNEFNRLHRVPALSAGHPEYDGKGDYWCGGVWPPTNYMVLRGLSRCGYDDLAHEIARNHLDNVVRVFQDTGTIWENYAPESAAPGDQSRPDMVGWGGLGPISVLLEYVLGLTPVVHESKIVWNVRLLGAHGVENYPFGKDGIVDLRCPSRASAEEQPQVRVKSNVPLRVQLVWGGDAATIQASLS